MNLVVIEIGHFQMDVQRTCAPIFHEKLGKPKAEVSNRVTSKITLIIETQEISLVIISHVPVTFLELGADLLQKPNKGCCF